MTIPLVREPESLSWLGSEHCAFCGQVTAYWQKATDVAVCQPCAEDHEEADLPTKEEWCESPQGKGKMKNAQMSEDIFVGVYPTGLVYADRTYEVDGDFARLGFLSFGTLKLDIETRCTPEQKEQIRNHAARLRARPGEQYQISQSGQTITLGHAMPAAAA